jgi:hypothetical protein
MPPLGTVMPGHDALEVVARWVDEQLSAGVLGAQIR